jgi:hypothetical protein
MATFGSQWNSIVDGYGSGVAASVVSVGGWYGIQYKVGSTTYVAYDATFTEAPTTAKLTNSWAGNDAGTQLGFSLTASYDIEGSGITYAQVLEYMQSVISAIQDLYERTSDAGTQNDTQVNESIGPGGQMATWLGYNAPAPVGEGYVPTYTYLISMAVFSGPVGPSFNPRQIGITTQVVPNVVQPIQAVMNNRRSVAATTQPTMSATPGGDPPVDNAGMFVIFGNPSSVNFTAEPVAGWTEVADSDVDIQDTQATLTIVGRCLTGKET